MLDAHRGDVVAAVRVRHAWKCGQRLIVSRLSRSRFSSATHSGAVGRAVREAVIMFETRSMWLCVADRAGRSRKSALYVLHALRRCCCCGPWRGLQSGDFATAALLFDTARKADQLCAHGGGGAICCGEAESSAGAARLPHVAARRAGMRVPSGDSGAATDFGAILVAKGAAAARSGTLLAPCSCGGCFCASEPGRHSSQRSAKERDVPGDCGALGGPIVAAAE